jgi:hypothetical protein
MASPFPGMDPYLEGYLWSDVHQSLAAQLKRQLSPLVRPNCVVRLARYMTDYQQSSPPRTLPAKEKAWLDSHLKQARLRQ